MIIAKELDPLCHYIRTSIAIALGGEPKDLVSDSDLENYIAAVDLNILNLLHDLLVMLDYFYALVLSDRPLENEDRELLDTAERLGVEVRQWSTLT